MMAARNFPRAKALAVQIVAADPRQPDALRALGEISLMQGLWDEARDYADRGVAERPDDPNFLALAARVAQARGDTPAALGWCDRLLAVRPGDPSSLLIKAAVLERSGDWQQAEQVLDSLRGSASPAAAQLRALVMLRKGAVADAVRVLDDALDRVDPTNAAAFARLLFVKAKALDRLGAFSAAFDAAARAKRAIAVPFQPGEYLAKIDEIVATFTRERLAMLPRARPTATGHVFIAGMPRSGTTLIEQILDAHPDAVGVGEAKEIDIAASRLPATLASPLPYPRCVAALTASHLQALRQEYEQAQLRHGFGPAPLMINKNLENHVHLGLIALLFPDARVIVPRREPRDLAVSCMMSHFRADKHPYLSSLEHIALAFGQWERLIDHWRTTLDLPMLEIDYEQVVRDPQASIRRLLDFVGLRWDDRCTRFWTSGRTVMTLSYDQVNRPIYDSSIGRWRNYERQLAPFVAARSDAPAAGRSRTV